jgi:hypothetical protein
MICYYKNKILLFLSVCLVYTAFLSRSICAETVTIGGKAGWKQLSVRNGIAEGTGRYGYKCVQLATNSLTIDSDTDLLLDFENGSFSDRSGHYKVKTNGLSSTSHAVMGKSAAFSRDTGCGLVLSGLPGSFFGTEGPSGSFSIEFWLAPSTADNGEVVFNWRSSRSSLGSIMYQMIAASFVENKLEWSFSNIFDGYTPNDGEVSIMGVSPVIPSKWSFHVISFDEDTGMLEYRVDGKLESVKYITSSGHERGTTYIPFFGIPSDVEICPAYTGRIDDFRIERHSYEMETSGDPDFVPVLKPDVYRADGGRFETQPLLTTLGSTLDSVTAVMNIPPQTAVCLFVRSGDNYFNWTETYPEWKPVESGKKLSGISGRYFQIAANLYPDGRGVQTPAITELQIVYTKPVVPLPPFMVRAEAEAGSVTLTWSYSVDESAGGYYVYYGTRSGEYLGRSAVEGASPVNAGNTTSLKLTGLKNGTIYYFVVSAWSKYDNRINGDFSKEVYARPVLK